jgi:methionyl-tRNA formyltransferase
MLKAIFMGSPDFSVPSLEAVAKTCELLAVVSQPDRPAGRGRKLKAPAVKEAAQALGVPVLQPTKVRDGSLREALAALAPDIILVTAYGRILPEDILSLPKYGCINVHASLLPRWRGAAPIQRAVLAGDRSTGVAIMQMDIGCDTGAVFEMVETPIGERETSGELFERLAKLGGEALESFLRRFPEVPEAREQDHEAAVHAAKLEKSEGQLDFARSAGEVHNHVRGMDPWPGAYCGLSLEGEAPLRVKVFASSLSGYSPGAAEAGEVIAVDTDGVHVACADGAVCLGELQAPGKRRGLAKAFADGRGLVPGARFGLA